MPDKPLIILHGWSDTSASFRPLAAWLRSRGYSVVPIHLGDYLSMNDEITLPDLGFAFRRALEANGIPQAPHSFDLVVHSTGGLVAREYLRQVCRGAPQRTPIEHLLMLAPANFGSPLAKMGKSALGRLLKGWDWDHLGETGQAVLDALELASPYSWQLALDDLFAADNALFDPAHTRVTVLTGTAAYDNLRRAVHENGSDGTVRVSTANLNASLLKVDFSVPTEAAHRFEGINCPPLAFAVFDRNHSSIHDPADRRQAGLWGEAVERALSVSAAGYAAHVRACQRITDQTYAEGGASARYHRFQHVVFHVHDQYGQPVEDYFVEFYQQEDDARDRVFAKIHGEILEKVTTCSVNKAFRSFLFDVDDLERFLARSGRGRVEMSISAAAVSRRIVYRNPVGGVPVFTSGKNPFLRPNAPVLVDITLHRDPQPEVFTLTKFPPA